MTTLMDKLLERGHEFSFVQVMRLARRHLDPEGEAGIPGIPWQERVTIRPELSLAFPAADVAKVERDGDSLLITAAFLGLYGPASPLPTFYTEDLMDEASNDESVFRNFLDIIHQRLYHLYIECWSKYRLSIRIIEENNPIDRERLLCLIGLGERELFESIPDSYNLLRYTGILTQHPRSATGFAALLRQKLEDDIPEFIPEVMGQLEPEHLRPVPAMTIIAFTPKEGLTRTQAVPARAEVASIQVQGTTCRFRTCNDVTVHLLTLLDASYTNPPGKAPCITLHFELTGTALSGWKIESRPLFDPLGDDRLWKLFGMQFINLKLLTTESLRTVLRLLYISDGQDRRSLERNDRHVEGIQGLHVEAYDRIVQQFMKRGWTIRMMLDPECYCSPGDMYCSARCSTISCEGSYQKLTSPRPFLKMYGAALSMRGLRRWGEGPWCEVV
jgi:hypothetical protein